MLEIAIAAHGLPFDGSTLEKRGLGGSETAVIYIARELQKIGHRVTVFCNTDEPGGYDGVNYVPLQNLQAVASSIEFDVLVVSRNFPMLNADIKARYRVLWNHDVFTNPALFSCLWQTDKVFLLSDYHISDYMEGDDKVPEFRDMIFKTSNGVDMELINKCKEGVAKVPGKIIYTSRPERGLHYLLQMLPDILKTRPDAKVYYCNYSLGKMTPHEADAKRLEVIEQMLVKFKDHVVNLGHLTKSQLYKEIASAEVHCIPTAFPEISCITAMEAPACGTPIICTNDFALKETVGHNKSGYRINGTPAAAPGSMELHQGYRVKFVRKLLHVLNSDNLKKRFEKSGPKWVESQGFTWPSVAKTWSDLFESELKDRYDAHPSAVWKELERQGNYGISDLLQDKPVNAEVFIPAFNGNDAELHVLSQQMTALGKVISGKVEAKTVLCANPTNPLIAVLLKRKMGDVEFAVYEEDPEYKKILEDVFEKNDVDIEVITNPTADTYDFILSHEAAAFTSDPSAYVKSLNSLLTENGHVCYITPYGPLASVHTYATRQRLWSIGYREWNDLLDGREGALTFAKMGETKEKEPYGSWLGLFKKFADFEPGVLNLERYTRDRPYQKVTACMIAYNAEDWILRCMKRILTVADRVRVVIDSKTDDRTRELIASFNDPRIETEECAFIDFETQRNISLGDTGMDTDPGWIIWLDTDEMLVQDSGLRKFLHGKFFNGYALPQIHLMLDVQGNQDTPIRIMRSGNSAYRFIGKIHEHCEDTSKGGYDNPIMPSMLLPGIQLAHYGYENEAQRRQKCSNRNMALLQKDLEQHPDRKLNKLLAIRDYMHIPKWEIDSMTKSGKEPFIERGSKLHRVLETAVDLWVDHLSDPDGKYRVLAFPHYQEALQMMAYFGLTYRDSPTPPFSLATAITAGVGGPAKSDLDQEVIWFRSVEESAQWMNTNMQSLAKQVNPNLQDAESLFPIPEIDKDVKYEDTSGSLLGLGKDRINEYGVLV